MADNFDLKKFLVENKLGAYSRLKEDNTSVINILRDIYYFDKFNELSAKDDVDEKYHKYGTPWASAGDTFDSDSEEYDMVTNSRRLKKGVDYNMNEAFGGINEAGDDNSNIESRIKQTFEKAGYDVIKVDYTSKSLVSSRPTVEVWFRDDIEEDLYDVLDKYDDMREEDDLQLTDVDQPYNRKSILRFYTY